MSGLKVCTKQSKTPYYISEIDLNVYSLEEICYFLYNYVYIVEKSFFSESLFDYLEHELNRASLAQRLRQYVNAKARLDEICMLVFKEANYYSEAEIRNIQPLLGSLDKKGTHERMQMKAESFYNSGKYEKALSIYFGILSMKREFSLPTEFYADIYFSIGVIYCKFFVYEMAEECFKAAYSLYEKSVYIKYLIMICKLKNDDEKELDIIRKYNVSTEILEECKADFEIIKTRAEARNEETINVDCIVEQYMDMLTN